MTQREEDSADGRLSPLPSPSTVDQHGGLPEGWVPPYRDTSPDATAWRARKALSMVYGERSERRKLAKSIDGLSTTITAWQVEGAHRWEVSGKLAKWAAGIVGALILVGASMWIWRWISTLHH